MRRGRGFSDSALWAGAALALAASTPARAGLFAEPSLRWSSFALRPVADEATPNYYGVGASATAGYSFAQVLDVGAFYCFVPARLKAVSLTGKDVTLGAYGADVAIRIADSVALDFRGGQARYHLARQTRPDELPGTWTGPAGAVGIGAVSRLGKQTFFQTSLELMHTVLVNRGDATLGKRRLDAFALSFAVVLNAGQKSRFEETIFRDFVDGLTFF